MSQLEKIIAQYAKLSSNAVQRLEQLASEASYQKGDLICRTGRYDNKEYIVVNGICRTCVFGPDGEDTTLSFFVPGSVLSPYVIRVVKELSILNIQASTDLDLITFDAAEFAQLMVDDPEVRGFGNEVLKRELAAMFTKEIGLASLTAKDRLLHFRKAFPMLENRVAHAEIASYLGITTISLSRLRKGLMT